MASTVKTLSSEGNSLVLIIGSTIANENLIYFKTQISANMNILLLIIRTTIFLPSLKRSHIIGILSFFLILLSLFFFLRNNMTIGNMRQEQIITTFLLLAMIVMMVLKTIHLQLSKKPQMSQRQEQQCMSYQELMHNQLILK